MNKDIKNGNYWIYCNNLGLNPNYSLVYMGFFDYLLVGIHQSFYVDR